MLLPESLNPLNDVWVESLNRFTPTKVSSLLAES
jgi:hypothetical protein